jgi:hypothetical protein
MKDLLVDTGRGHGYGKADSRRFRFKHADPNDLPRLISTARCRQEGHKNINDRTNPLRKFLRANCGRPWDDVYREICAVADGRTIRGRRLRQCALSYVVPNNYDVGHNRRYGPFFVDADGTLQEEREKTEAERRAEAVYWRKRHKWKEPPRMRANPRIAVDADHWYERIEGYWFAFETKHYTCRNSREDLVEENGEVKIVRIALPDITMRVTSKKQVNGKTQKELEKRYGQTKRN